MQVALMMAAKALPALAASGAGSSAAGAAAGGSSLLKGLRIGTSAISALSGYSQAKAQADQAKAEAFSEDLQGRQEFIQAQEKANAIARAYNTTVEDQMSSAAAGGVSITSGSVVAAREAAQTDADRQLGINRRGAELNAVMRRGRAAALRAGAKATKKAGILGAVAKAGETAIQLAAAG